MSIYQNRNPLGFKNLLTWQQSDTIYTKIKNLASRLPRLHPKTNQFTNRLTDHLIDSARSVKRNIEEGFKRATTSEYIKFLGFSRGSLEELHGDLIDLEKDVVEWENQRETRGNNSKGAEEMTKSLLEDPSEPPWNPFRISREKVGELIKLCRGEDKMLGNQIKGLEKRRESMGYKTNREQEQFLKQGAIERSQKEKKFLSDFQEEAGLVRLVNGQFIDKEEYSKRIQSGEKLKLWLE